jgi:uncharacterized SAM-binding protein YcdF (DUF218 family)
MSKKIWRSLQLIVLFSISLLCLSLLFNLTLKLPNNANRPVDAFLVLGGSISREIYVAKLAKQDPDIPILISQGSQDPCIVLIFQREQTRLNNVWLEKCADSTFGNFWFSLPILNNWHVHKVKLITSASHLPRAEWLGRIFLNSHGIGVELDIVPEQGVPGNREFFLKTGLDLTRSLLWALLGQVIQPSCSEVTELIAVDLESWQEKGFKCERQAELLDLN